MLSKKKSTFTILAFMLSALHQTRTESASSESTRTIKFPDKAIGSIYISTDEISTGRDVTKASTRYGFARGTVTLKVPGNKTLLLDLNPDAFMHPAVLNEVSEHGIERLRFAYCSMDDQSSVHCDDALKMLPHFKDLISIDVDRSDATDAGLACAKGMSKLKSVSAFASDVKGRSFKALQSCPALEEVDIDHCAIDGACIKDLAGIKKLKSTRLRETGLSDKALPDLAACTAITDLDISGNPKITDKSIGTLKSLRNLQKLELKNTGVTIAGLRTLKGLPLEKIVIGGDLNSAASLTEVRQLFPKAQVVGSSKRVVTSDEKTMFAPLK